ncbi:MAG: LysE family transporter [Candidatus Kapabacteria bacterium]|nr:LysE family transporter [Candidatus Kapabacteria bacterium]
MIVALLIGIVVGFVLAIPPGPIGMASVRVGLRDGWRQAFKLSVGAGLFDLIYCSLAMWASSGVVNVLHALEADNPMVTLGIQFIVAAVMIGFGITQIRESPVIKEGVDKHHRGEAIINRVSSNGPFFVGIGFALANLANPTFIPTVVAMTTFVQKVGFFEQDLSNAIAFSLGFGIGNALWLTTLVRLVLAFRGRMTPTFMHRIEQFTGVTLVGFGLYYAIRLLAVI